MLVSKMLHGDSRSIFFYSVWLDSMWMWQAVYCTVVMPYNNKKFVFIFHSVLRDHSVCSLSEMDKTTFYSRKASSLYLQNNLKTILFYIAYSFFFLNSFTASEMSCGKKTVKHFRKQYLTLFGLIPTFQHTPMEVLNTIQQHGIYSNVLVHAALFSQHVWTGKQHEYKKIMCTEMSFKGQVKATSVMNSTQTKVCMLKSIVIFFFFLMHKISLFYYNTKTPQNLNSN